jgi:hypothetical protein
MLCMLGQEEPSAIQGSDGVCCRRKTRDGRAATPARSLRDMLIYSQPRWSCSGEKQQERIVPTCLPVTGGLAVRRVAGRKGQLK